jgi:vacuolar-type H+-ATPase subunit H
MKRDILNEVIELEWDIHERLLAEKTKAGEWVDEVRKKAEKDILLEEEKIKGLFEQAIKNARLDAEKKAHEIISDANEKAERLAAINDEFLIKIIQTHIVRILPKI